MTPYSENVLRQCFPPASGDSCRNSTEEKGQTIKLLLKVTKKVTEIYPLVLV